MLMVAIIPKFRRKIKKKLRGVKKGFMWNGYIRSTLFTYMKQFVSFALASTIVDFKDPGAHVANAATIFTGLILIAFPIWTLVFLYKYQDKLHKKTFKAKFESLYMGLDIENRMALWYPLLFMFRRGIFVFIAVIPTPWRWL